MTALRVELSRRGLANNDSSAWYTASSFDAVLNSLFEWWNLLDRQMYIDAPLYAYQTGYVRELQVRRMVELARALPPRSTYCEIGLNGGHSMVAMLLANPALTAHSFDLLALPYSESVKRLLQRRFGVVTFHPGSSRKGVREGAGGDPARPRRLSAPAWKAG